MTCTASAGAALTSEFPGNDGETPDRATATNGTATDTEAPTNGKSNQANNNNAAQDETVKGSGGNNNDADGSNDEEVPALSGRDRIRGEMNLKGIECSNTSQIHRPQPQPQTTQ